MRDILVLISDKKGESSNSYAIFNKIRDILGDNDYNYNVILLNDRLMNNDLEVKKLIKKTVKYNNVILSTNLQENNEKDNAKALLNVLIDNKDKINKDLMFSIIINYTNIDIRKTEKHLTEYEKMVKKIGFSWQKGISTTLQKDAWKEDLKKNKKRYSPLMLELEFLCANIESNKKCYDYSFVTPYMPKSIFNGLNKLDSLKEKYFSKN